uniref:Lipid-binding serum glycoprotein C-terminal domain-containing protein n=2 Tax=Biomphalaria glabrata TaxID=6526 RepID=A0A2C9JBI2_BIOGL
MARAITLLMLCVTIGLTVTQNPGVKIRVTAKGVDYAKNVARASLVPLLNNIRLDDVEGRQGKTSYRLHNFRTSNVRIPNINMHLNPGQRGLTLNLRNFGIDIRLDYRVSYRVLFARLTNSGGVTVNFGQVDLTVTIGIDQFQDTSPKLVARSCSGDIGHFNIHFHGRLAWLLNLLRGLFRGQLHNSIRNKICEVVVNAVNNDAANKLRRMTLEADIGNNVGIDYRLLAPLLFTDNYLELHQKGTVFWKAARNDLLPVSPGAVPAWGDYSNMFYLWLTEYPLKSLAYIMHTRGRLQYSMTVNTLLEERRDFLSTSCDDSLCVGFLIPKLSETFPNSVVALNITSRKIPDVNITINGVGMTFYGTVDLSIPSAGSVLVANVTVSFRILANVRNDRIVGHVNSFSTIIESLHSVIGDVDLTVINNAIEEGLTSIIIPEMNAVADVGVKLPLINDLVFQRPSFIYLDGALIIGTDVQYQGIV